MIRLPTVSDIAARIRKDRQVLGAFAYLLDALFLGLFLFLLALMLPSFVKAREKAKEGEVKANLRVIQIALERYAVDTGGLYPLTLYGGHPSDTFATTRSPEVSEFPGDVDWLLQSRYLAAYPENPFRRGSKAPMTVDARPYFKDCVDILCDQQGQPAPRVNIWNSQGTRGDVDRSRQWIPRQVGGPLGDKMWDVSEGQRHPPFLIHIFPHDGFGPNPCPQPKCERARFRDDYNCWLNVGNFYYYPTFWGIGNLGSYETVDGKVRWELPMLGTPTGYKLCAFGAQSNPGQDPMYAYGEFPDFSLNMGIRGEAVPDNMYVGPDGRRDGVIKVSSPGSDNPLEYPQVKELRDDI